MGAYDEKKAFAVIEMLEKAPQKKDIAEFIDCMGNVHGQGGWVAWGPGGLSKQLCTLM